MHVCFPWCLPRWKNIWQLLVIWLYRWAFIQPDNECIDMWLMDENIMSHWFSRLNNCYTNVNVENNFEFSIGLFPLKKIIWLLFWAQVNLSDFETRFQIIALKSLVFIGVSPHSHFNVPFLCQYTHHTLVALCTFLIIRSTIFPVFNRNSGGDMQY